MNDFIAKTINTEVRLSIREFGETQTFSILKWDLKSNSYRILSNVSIFSKCRLVLCALLLRHRLHLWPSHCKAREERLNRIHTSRVGGKKGGMDGHTAATHHPVWQASYFKAGQCDVIILEYVWELCPALLWWCTLVVTDSIPAVFSSPCSPSWFFLMLLNILTT